MADDNVPVAQRVFGPGHYLPPQMIQPFLTDTVLIQGVTIINSPFWHLNPNLCSNVTVEGVSISSSGPNTDGCDPESCTGVVIDGVTFNTGDDCIAIKSGRDADGRRVNVPSQDLVIQNCTFANGHGGITIGSEMTGGVRNVRDRPGRHRHPGRPHHHHVDRGQLRTVRIQSRRRGRDRRRHAGDVLRHPGPAPWPGPAPHGRYRQLIFAGRAPAA
jgi:hypothetical protein